MVSLAQGFDAQGHRGARGLSPENTLVSFARALSIGVNTLELDVGMTHDDVVIVSHNPTLDPNITRDSMGHWIAEPGPAIRSLTLDELKTYDVGGIKPGTRYHRRFPEQVPESGVQLPTLEEVILLLKRSGSDQVNLNIETKSNPEKAQLSATPENFVDAVLQVLKKHDFLHRVTIQSFDWRTLLITQRKAPDMTTSYLTVQQDWFDTIQAGKPGPSPWTAGYDIDEYGGNLPQMIKAAGGHIWSSHHQEVTAELIEQAHHLGLEVKVWTVNQPEQMEALINLGVDGIITDYPDRLRDIMRKLGMPTPVPTSS